MPLPTKRSYLIDYILTGLIFISLFGWILPSRLLFGRLTTRLKGGWPGASGSNRGKIPYNLQGANGTDKNVIEIYKKEADKISYHAAKFEENVINTTAVRSQIRSVEIILDDPVDEAVCLVVVHLQESLECVMDFVIGGSDFVQALVDCTLTTGGWTLAVHG
jgi:hypothetical protein